jgi:hypothetical protein
MATRSAPGLLDRLMTAFPSLRRTEQPTVEDHCDVPEPVLCRGDCNGDHIMGPSIETVAAEHGDWKDWFFVQDEPINHDAPVLVCSECDGIAGVLGAHA